METAFKPVKGVTRVNYGADPRVEITSSRPYKTSNPQEIAELRELEHLQEVPAASSTPKKSGPKAKAAVKPAPAPEGPAGGEQA